MDTIGLSLYKEKKYWQGKIDGKSLKGRGQKKNHTRTCQKSLLKPIHWKPIVLHNQYHPSLANSLPLTRVHPHLRPDFSVIYAGNLSDPIELYPTILGETMNLNPSSCSRNSRSLAVNSSLVIDMIYL